MKKKLVSLVLSLCMLLALLPAASAEEWVGDFTVERSEYEVVLKHYYGDGGAVTVPAGVTSIGDRAFTEDAWRGCDGLTSVVIPEGVTGIGNWAFANCANLTSVSLPSTLTSIGSGAFEDCISLTSVTIPNGVTYLADSVFAGCSSLTSVTIPETVTYIGPHLFSKCANLTTANIPQNITEIPGSLFEYCTSLSGAVIPEGVTSIGPMSFYECDSLTSMTIPSTVAYIGDDAFALCDSLTNLTFQPGVPCIDGSAFLGCKSLTSVYIPFSVKSIGPTAFAGCDKLTDVYYEGSKAQWKAVKIYRGNDSVTNAAMHYDSAIPSAPVQPGWNNAAPTSAKVMVNNQYIAFDAYVIEGNNYFKLRDLAYVLNGTEKQFEVGWDSASRTITLTSGQSYTANGSELASGSGGSRQASPSASKLLIDGREVSLTAYTIDGSNYFKLRDIGQAFDFGIGWDSATKTITITTGVGYIA